MIKSKEEYYSILERLRTLNFNQKLSRNLQAKLEAFEEMEELVNLIIPVVSTQSEPFVSLIEWLKNHKHSENLYKETPECIVKYYFKEINGY